jgi:hypothetical protein
MSAQDPPLSLAFRCPKELEGLIPPPVPAAAGLPDWLKAMPAEAASELSGASDDTVKRCPPFIDAMTQGFLIPLICDVTVEDGRFTWDFEFPPGGSVGFARSPIGVHEPAQVAGTPLFDPDRFLIKFHNLWTIEAPPGYAVLITHPANRFDLPFTTLSGLVDCDRYKDGWINFPAIWRDPGFRGVLRKGTPVAQCVPVKRARWAMQQAPFSDDDARATHALLGEIRRDRGVYRKRFRA